MIRFTIKQSGVADRLLRFEAARITIGRLPDSDVVLADREVSRRHVLIERRGGGYVVMDRGSKAGTYVGGRRIEPERAEPLGDGACIGIGPFDVFFHDLERSAEGDTMVPFDPKKPARAVADELCRVYARHLEDPTEVRVAALRTSIHEHLGSASVEDAGEILRELQQEFGHEQPRPD